MMPRCPQCNERNPSRAKSCLHCGALIQSASKQSSGHGLFTTRTLDDGSVEVRGPLPTIIGTIIVMGLVVLLILVVTGRVELETKPALRCVPKSLSIMERRLIEEGYVFDRERMNSQGDFERCFRPPPAPGEEGEEGE